MRKAIVALLAAATVATAVPAFAELQNVTVGGSIRIRGSWYSTKDLDFDNKMNWEQSFNQEQNIKDQDALIFEQRTTINVTADFTKDVHAFIELDSYNTFGDGFRGLDEAGGNYALTGYDWTANSSGTPVSLYQGYIKMDEAWGYPVSIKIGRSEMADHDEFLIGNNNTSSNFKGLSFDGVWVDYKNDSFNVGGFWTRPFSADSFASLPGGPDGSADINFTGLHGAYTGIENMEIGGAYYYYQGSAMTPSVSYGSDSQAFHTISAYFSGNKAQFDWSIDGAYQFGDSGLTGVNQNAFAFNGNAGYTFDVNMQPHLFVNGAYYEGMNKNGTSLGFNRLFSDLEYDEFLDATDMGNFWNVGGGVSAQVTEAINLKGLVNYLAMVQDTNYGLTNPSKNLGVEAEIICRYNYSEDLYFEAGYAHLFSGKAFADTVNGQGAVIFHSGTGSAGGFGKHGDIDYVYVETGIKF